MIDHLGVHVADLDASKAFYLQALAPLGYGVPRDYGAVVGLGADQKPDFWLTYGQANTPGLQLAFAAKDHATVDAFYAAAIAAGAKDNGAPGPRPQYHPGYYGAFVLDLNGHNLEVVCHRSA